MSIQNPGSALGEAIGAELEKLAPSTQKDNLGVFIAANNRCP
jgi:hypothetical protein